MPPTPPHVAVVYAGGTIGMVDDGSGWVAGPGVEAAVREIAAGLRTAAGPPPAIAYTGVPDPIDSADADTGSIHELAENLARIARDPARRPRLGAVLLHGTDTMAYVGARLAFDAAELGLPLVVTGSMVPLGAPGTDAPANLRLALGALADGTVTDGTWIAFGGRLHLAVRATKAAVDDVAGFTSTPSPAPVTPGRLPGDPTGYDDHATPIGLVTMFPGLQVSMLEEALARHPRGLVLECYGAGTLPAHRPGLVDAVARATAAGTPVVVVSQCATGSVDLPRYAGGRALLAAGAVSGGDLTREGALAKLDHLTARGLDVAQVVHWMGRNLLGEGCAR